MDANTQLNQEALGQVGAKGDRNSRSIRAAAGSEVSEFSGSSGATGSSHYNAENNTRSLRSDVAFGSRGSSLVLGKRKTGYNFTRPDMGALVEVANRLWHERKKARSNASLVEDLSNASNPVMGSPVTGA